MSKLVDIVGSRIADLADEIGLMFKPGAKVTVIVRAPGFNDRDLLVTSDTIDEVIALLQRSKERDERDVKRLNPLDRLALSTPES